MAVIILFNRRYIAVETAEALYEPFFIHQQGGRLFQFLIGLESGKDKDILFQVLSHDGRDDTALDGRRNRTGESRSIFIDEFPDGLIRNHLQGKAVFFVDMPEGFQ